MNKLIVLNQKISEWEQKGEIQYKYFNPKKKYNFIAILSFVEKEKPSTKSLKKLCGGSKFKFLTIENKYITRNSTKYFLPFFLYKKIIYKELDKLNLKKPHIVRCIGDGFIGYLSSIISNYYSCKLIISIHTFMSLKIFLYYLSFKEKIFHLLNLRFKKKSHNLADKIIIPYMKIKDNIHYNFKSKVIISYNQIHSEKKLLKRRLTTSKKIKFVFVGRLIKGKSILNIIKAINQIENVSLTIFGDGPERKKIEDFILLNKLKNRVFVKGFVNNQQILANFKTFDAFIAYHKFYEFPKTIIEALVNGLPIILNKNPSKEIFEFKNIEIIWTDGTVNSYKKKIESFKNKTFDINFIIKKNYFEIKKLLKINNPYD